MRRFALAFAGFALAAVLSRAAEIPSADEIVNKANLASYYAGKDGRADVKMTITDKQGRVRTREFTILRMDIEDGGEQRFYVYFKRPPDVAKMAYLVWKHPGKDDDRWLYLPAMDLVNRIAASDKRTSFVGSDFLYEDISGRGIDEDKHEYVGEDDGMYVIKNTPLDPKSVEFAYYKVWIDEKTFLPMKAEYYDAQGRHYRTVEALEVKEIEGFPTVMKSRASDLAAGSNTVTEFSNINYDIGLDESVFQERYLRRPPRKWLR